MCAITGWSGRAKRGQWRIIHRFLTELLSASAVRGTDATGFAAIDGKKGFISEKRAVRSPAFAASNAAWNGLSYATSVIAHCRAATHGSPSNNDNNHPHVGDEIAVIVNGIAHNYVEVAEKLGLVLNSECDSEIVLRLVERQDNPAIGLRDALTELRGGMAAAVLDCRRKAVWLARDDGRPAWLLKLAGVDGHFFCSTHDIARQAIQRTFGKSTNGLIKMLIPLPSQAVVRLSADGRLMAAVETKQVA
jgi:glucosamine 6-phosphate synthetase-like amidotransferase/phosphosugar isomerase protein